MCIAVAKPAGIEIDKETLQECFKSNPDGCGFAYIDGDNNIVIFKSMEFAPFYEKYTQAFESYPDSPFLIHFRIKTHGTKDIFNCHPFRINEDTAFIHNGIIRLAPDCPEKKRSDTQMFNDTILKDLPDGWHKLPALKPLIEEYVGATSKLVILDRRDRSLTIFCESKGHWHEGIWWSNSSYKKVTSYYSSSTYNGRGYYDTAGKWVQSGETTYTNTTKKTCLFCKTDVTNNLYARNVGKDYCSKHHRKLHEKELKFNNAKDGKRLTILNDQNCLIPKDQVLSINDGTKDEQSLIRCLWCNTYHEGNDIVDVIFGEEHDLICLECLSHAAEIGWIEKTPQVASYIELYFNSLKDAEADKKAGITN